MHRPARALATVLALCALPLAGVAVEAEESRPASPGLARIAKTGEIRVGMSGEQPPLSMTGRDGQLFGLDVALARVLARSMGVKLRLVQLPFNRLLDALDAGEIELVMSGMTITPLRSARVRFIGPYYTSGKTILTRKLSKVEGGPRISTGRACAWRRWRAPPARSSCGARSRRPPS